MQVSNGVFKALVASQNVANALVVIGVLRLGSSSIFLHSSLDLAKRVFAMLPELESEVEDGVLSAHVDSTTTVLRAAAVTAFRLHLSLHLRQTSETTPHLNAPAPAPDTACTSVLTPLEPSIGSLVANSPTSLPGILGPPPKPPSYLQALLSPAIPKPAPRPPPKPLNNPRACFRCLASDHFVCDCRDPVRCRRCRGFGHRAHACTMLNRALSPLLHRMPASWRSVHAVPYDPRNTTASPRPPPSPSPPPEHHLAFIIPSSSSSPPDLELNPEPQLPAVS